MSHLLVYLIVILGSISNLFAIFGAFALIGFVFLFLFGVACDPSLKRESRKTLKKWVISLLCAGFLFVSLSHLTPNMKQAAAIYLIPKISNNEEVQDIPQNAMEMLNKKMESYVEDVTKEEEDEGEE